MEFIQSQEQKEETIEIKIVNKRLMGLHQMVLYMHYNGPRGIREKENGAENLFKEIMAGNFSGEKNRHQDPQSP